MTTHYIDYENGNDANDGAAWVTAWKTITGAIAASIAPGDECRIAKSPAPYTIGTCTWTDLSKTVTRTVVEPGTETLLIDDCESGWVAANSSTVTHPTTAIKSGSAAMNVTKATYATGTLYAYKALAGATDFSDFEAITLWVRVSGGTIADADRWAICLCSDAAGATPVDSFSIPAIPASGANLGLRIAKTGGGALGASIQSIAIYSGTSAPTNGQALQLDNINACNSFSLCSLISKSSADGWVAEGAYPPQSINGNTLLIDNHVGALPSAGRGYSGSTETVATYARETIKTPVVGSYNTVVQEVQDSGTDGSPITFSGGWNTSSDLQDGLTIYDGRNSYGVGLQVSAKSFVALERLGFVRYDHLNIATAPMTALSEVLIVGMTGTAGAALLLASSPGAALESVFIANSNPSGTGILLSAAPNSRLEGVSANGQNVGLQISFSPNMSASGLVVRNNAASGMSAVSTANARGGAMVARDNATAAIVATSGARIILDAVADISGTLATFTSYADGRVMVADYDGNGRPGIVTDGGVIDRIATDFAAPATGDMWRLLTSATHRTASYPLVLELPGMALVANKLVTIKAVLKKAHASEVEGGIRVRGGRIAGVPSDVVATLADNTDEQELTLTFTPTEGGKAVVVEVWAAYVSGHAAVYIDRFTEMKQAA